MLISNIIGGLGNQMFQYAAGRALALKLGCDFTVDLRSFEGYQLHQGFELERLFSCPVKVASNTDLNTVLGWQSGKLAQRFLKRPQFKTFRKNSFVIEPHFHYWSGINQLKDNIYLDGYWQSERYFIGAEETIRKDFSFKLPLSGKNVEVAKHIAEVNAVSLHVRRGDYVTNSKNAFIGTCSIDYYQRAIAYIKEQVSNPVFFVFSDDVDWVKENLPIDAASHFIDHNSQKESYNDMRLMSLCQHHIIANSSFSWWGAWLNARENKVVIAPKQWFANGQSTVDLIPNQWIRL